MSHPFMVAIHAAPSLPRELSPVSQDCCVNRCVWTSEKARRAGEAGQAFHSHARACLGLRGLWDGVHRILRGDGRWPGLPWSTCMGKANGLPSRERLRVEAWQGLFPTDLILRNPPKNGSRRAPIYHPKQ